MSLRTLPLRAAVVGIAVLVVLSASGAIPARGATAQSAAPIRSAKRVRFNEQRGRPEAASACHQHRAALLEGERRSLALSPPPANSDPRAGAASAGLARFQQAPLALLASPYLYLRC